MAQLAMLLLGSDHTLVEEPLQLELDAKSTIGYLLFGVPQGSILGPLLFNILVSNVRQFIEFSTSYEYADDIQLKINTK